MKKKYLILSLLASCTMIVTGCGKDDKKDDNKKDKAELSEIKLSGNPKTNFFVNDEFTYEGLIVTAYYSDNTNKKVTSYQVAPPDMTTSGTRPVYVTYTENSIKKESSYNVTVSNITLLSLSLSGDYETEFLLGDTFSSDGLIVTAHYSDGSESVLASYSISSPDMSVAGEQTVTVSSGNTSTSYTIIITDDSGLNTLKEAAQAAVRAAFNELDVDEYSIVRWNKIVDKFNSAIKAISRAISASLINDIKEDAISYFENSPTATEVRQNTWFDYGSADGKYSFDRDDDNNLVIMYDDYPGHWVYVGTKTNLDGDINQYNALSLTFRNDSEEQIEVCLQATDASGSYKVDSHTMTVAGLETKTIRLDFDISVSRLYFFVDSCSEHHRAGQVTILESKLLNEERPFSLDPKTVSITDGTFSTEGNKGNSIYTLTAEDNPSLIERVSATLQVDFHGNGDSKKWFGLHLYKGSVHESFSDSQVHARGIDDGEYAIYTSEISSSKVLKTGDEIALDVSYQAENLTFKVLSYTFIYGQFKETTTETVQVNKDIYAGVPSSYKTTFNSKAEFLAADTSSFSAGDVVRVKGDDPYGASFGYYSWTGSEWNKVGGADHVKVPYSSFTKKGAVKKMEVEFETVNTASYAKSQVYISNFNFAVFPGSGNNNVLNLAPVMDKSSETPKTGTMTLYPLENVDLNSDEIAFEIDCWWSSASRITIKSITLTTEFIGAPGEVENLEAHPIDSGMVLTWSSVAHAESYDVYVNGSKVLNTKRSNAILESLVNGTEYTFGVIAKNATGESEMVSVKSSPVEGAKYDTFIESLNTPLEEYLGDSKIAAAFNQGNTYISNSQFSNYRVKKLIEKMRNGEETTVAFMGGSITVGETAKLRDENNHAKGYAYYTYQWLKNNYDVANKSHFVNGSISGTGSEIGIVRAQKDILDHNPDLVFIEFAANNGSTDYYKQSYESLIRKVLDLPNDPAIVLVFSCTTYTNNGTEDRYMKQIGEYYRLPMVSVDKALRAVFSNITKEDAEFKKFSDDGTHPNDEGHQLMAKIICNYLREIILRSTDADYTKPVAPSQSNYDKYEGLVSVDHNSNDEIVTSFGSFKEGNTGTPATRDQSDVTAFQQGWIKSASAENDAMTLEVNAKNFIIIYCAGNQAGDNTPRGNIVVSYVNKADSSDSGELTWNLAKTCKQNDSSDMDTITESGNGWDNPCGILVFDKASAANYQISISVTGNSSVTAEQAICWIMAFGYTA